MRFTLIVLTIHKGGSIAVGEFKLVCAFFFMETNSTNHLSGINEKIEIKPKSLGEQMMKCSVDNSHYKAKINT